MVKLLTLAMQLQEERRRTREDERRHLVHQHSLQIDRSKLKEVLKAGPSALHAESQAAVQDSPNPALSRSYAVTTAHVAALSMVRALLACLPS